MEGRDSKVTSFKRCSTLSRPLTIQFRQMLSVVLFPGNGICIIVLQSSKPFEIPLENRNKCVLQS